MSSVVTEILENVKVFAQCRRRRRQGYDTTSTFSSKTAELKIYICYFQLTDARTAFRPSAVTKALPVADT